MSSDKATQTSTEYYLYNPLTGQEHNATFTDFNTACNTARSLRGTWEVHAVSARKRGKK